MSKVNEEAEIRKNYERLTRFLIRKGWMITTMESATSGLVASLITDTPGASGIFKGGFITYSNEAKLMQGVPKECIDTFSVYSKETAAAMAESCRSTYRADLGIGVTGTLGNVDPENAEYSTVGVLYFAIATRKETHSYRVELLPNANRYMDKLAAANEVYHALVKVLDLYET